MDRLEDICTMGGIVVGVAMVLVPLLQLGEEGTQTRWRNLEEKERRGKEERRRKGKGEKGEGEGEERGIVRWIGRRGEERREGE